MVVFRSGAGGARLRLFEAGPAAPNLHLKNVLRVKSDVVSEPEADGARLRLLEPALLLRQICTSAPNFGAGSGFRSPGAAPTRCAKAHHPLRLLAVLQFFAMFSGGLGSHGLGGGEIFCAFF